MTTSYNGGISAVQTIQPDEFAVKSDQELHGEEGEQARVTPAARGAAPLLCSPLHDFAPGWEVLRLNRSLNTGEYTIFDESVRNGEDLIVGAMPPASNTGVSLYKAYEWEESELEKVAVMVDTLSLTLRLDDMPCPVTAFSDIDRINYLSKSLAQTFGIEFDSVVTPGRNFYKNKMGMKYTDNRPARGLGFVNWGGNNNTVQIYFSGELMSYINANFPRASLHGFAVHFKAKISRTDLAYDDLEGKHDLSDAVEMYKAGGFDPFHGGRRPKINQNGDWISDVDHNGRTLYVGSRSSGKLLRAYEKGKQLGDKESKWVRWEIEYLANNGRVLPLDILLNPHDYFAGSYPGVAEFVPATIKTITTVLKRRASLMVEGIKANVKKQYGRYLWVLSELFGDGFAGDLFVKEIPKGFVMPLPVQSIPLGCDAVLDDDVVKVDGLIYG